MINLAACVVALGLLFAATMAISIVRDRHDTLDITWGLGFALIAIVSFGLSHGYGDPVVRTLVTGLTMLWGLRLAVHIGLRHRGSDEDARYTEIRRKARGNPLPHLLRTVYVPQGAALLLISLPVQATQYTSDVPTPLLAAGTIVWLIGFLFEAVGDWQLARFKGDPANRGRVMDRGLWRYTRHPNYFGDACVWWGLYLLACGTWLGAATVLSPVAMTFFQVAKTGKPMMERHLRASRPGYARYVARTSGFLPLPPRTDRG